MLKRCQERGISYVELLKERDGRAEGRNAMKNLFSSVWQVRTFVSHWWGEEFKDFVDSLERYATSRCLARL